MVVAWIAVVIQFLATDFYSIHGHNGGLAVWGVLTVCLQVKTPLHMLFCAVVFSRASTLLDAPLSWGTAMSFSVYELKQNFFKNAKQFVFLNWIFMINFYINASEKPHFVQVIFEFFF